MKKIILCIILFNSLTGCKDSGWITIEGKGIDDEAKSISQTIYFENLNRGVVGGYTLSGTNSDNKKLEFIPTLYLTEDGGLNWERISFDSEIKESIENAYLNFDTLVCQTDFAILFSINKGQSFDIIQNKTEYKSLSTKYFQRNRSDIEERNFIFENTNYRVKEIYKNSQATLIVCNGLETLTDYYFVTFDDGKKWKYLQNDFGDNRQRFLFEDKYLFAYDFPFGLQKLELK